MPILALILILSSSFLHAGWNFLAKQSRGGLVFTWLFGALSVAVYTPMALWLIIHNREVITPVTVLFILGSAVLHVGYFGLLQQGYRVGDMSLVYPVARGTAPLLTTIVATTFFGENITVAAGIGIALIVTSTVIFSGANNNRRFKTNEEVDDENSADERRRVKQAIMYGVITGVFITSYTLWDKYAMSRFPVPPLVYDWGTNVIRTMLLSPIFFSRPMRTNVVETWHTSKKQAWGIAILSPFAYILVLTAMTFTPVSYVAPLREMSILIGTILGARYLKEGHGRRRIIAAFTMMTGVILIALKG